MEIIDKSNSVLAYSMRCSCAMHLRFPYVVIPIPLDSRADDTIFPCPKPPQNSRGNIEALMDRLELSLADLVRFYGS